MKKWKVITIVFWVFGTTAIAQKQYPLRSMVDSLNCTIQTRQQQVVLMKPENTSALKAKNGFPAILDIRIEEADLILEFENLPPRETWFDIEISIRMPDGQLLAAPPEALQERLGNQNSKIKIWQDVTEYFQQQGMSFTLFIKRSQMGIVNCEAVRPTFGLKQKLPYFSAAGVGLVMIGLGQVYRVQQNDYYRSYQQTWNNGSPRPSFEDDPRQKALNSRKNFRTCTWIGMGLLAVDATLFTTRYLKIRRKQKVYDQFCQPATLQLKSDGPGMGLLLKF